ncbi:MAG: hypothetical protein HYX56_01560 [Chloroflexi bacterium]|nr:hypothetical protein [Chloroflexota bacterium]
MKPSRAPVSAFAYRGPLSTSAAIALSSSRPLRHHPGQSTAHDRYMGLEYLAKMTSSEEAMTALAIAG